MMVLVEPEIDCVDPTVEVYEALFRAHYVRIRSYVRRVWPSVDDDDVVSQTFEIAWRRLEDIPTDATQGWLVGVAKNCALNALRSARRRTEHFQALTMSGMRTDTDLFDGAVPADTAEALQRAMRGLSESDQEILSLAAWAGLSGEDLGAALGVSASTAAVRLFRARSRLKERYEREGSDQR